MSILDKLKSIFSGGSDTDAHSHNGHDHSHDGHDHAVEDAPAAAPYDPLGTSIPEAGPVPPAEGSDDKTA